jgi:small subunit ribosomal protein S16
LTPPGAASKVPALNSSQEPRRHFVWRCICVSPVKARRRTPSIASSPPTRAARATAASSSTSASLEHIGIYDPTRQPEEIRFDEERLAHYLAHGATPSETVGQLIKKSRKAAEPKA